MIQRIKNKLHLGQALIANIISQFPAKKIKVIAVTGTDGKTTTTLLIYHILKSSGKKVAAISTVGAFIGGNVQDIGFHVTTPSPFQLQKYIRKVKEVGCEYLVLEVTSHAIDQNRIFGIKPYISVLTNVTHEHLDYHKTYEDYLRIKMKLLFSAEKVVVNRDDASFKFISNIKNQKSNMQIKNQTLITYGIKNKADVSPQNFSFKTNLFGEFNKYNCLAACAVCNELGLDKAQIRKGIATFVAPVGRQSIVSKKDFSVMIDFAHTPNAFERLLSDLRSQTKGKLIHVFGSAGERDASKRPLMGKASARYSDIIILTSEDPRSESPEAICKQISSEIFNFQFSIFNEFSMNQFKKKQKYLFIIPDRKKAIKFAIKIASKGDLVIVTGKGHEKSMNYGEGEVAWDEYEEVRAALEKR